MGMVTSAENSAANFLRTMGLSMSATKEMSPACRSRSFQSPNPILMQPTTRTHITASLELSDTMAQSVVFKTKTTSFPPQDESMPPRNIDLLLSRSASTMKTVEVTTHR